MRTPLCEPTHVSDGPSANMKLLIDEDLSPTVANRLRVEDGIDAVHVRDRGKLGEPDHHLLEYAYEEDRILVTCNVGDFRRLVVTRPMIERTGCLKRGPTSASS